MPATTTAGGKTRTYLTRTTTRSLSRHGRPPACSRTETLRRAAGRPGTAVTLVLTAVIAAAAGFLAVIAVRDLSARPAAASSVAPASGRAPSAGAPASGGPAPRTVPGGGQTVQLEIGGKVTAVSATSITVAGPGHQVTAAVTSATKVSGRVSNIGGVRAGDEVSLQATATGGKLTATAIQDPASLP